MKKRLLTLGAIVTYLSLNAQSVVTYIGNNAKLYVSKDALVYSGGKWKVDSNVEKSVENRGNIIIEGNYVKGVNNNGEDGKEFVNIYTEKNDYGQVKILSPETPTARMTLERPAATKAYFGASYAIGIPFIDDVKYIMHSFGKKESDFRGDCNINQDCARRYMMTLTRWNNNSLQHDAVPSSVEFSHGYYYNLNLRGQDMQDVMTGTVKYKGTPSGRSYTQTAKGVIHGLDEKTFSDLGYNSWKKRRNPYQEAYETYLGYRNTNSKLQGKNVYRFANPYTSNLDLSEVDGANAWLKIKNNGGDRSIKAAYTENLIVDFSVRKRADDYDVDWGKIAGATRAKASYHIAKFDGNSWTGSAEALLIRPMETFNLHFPALNVAGLGNTRILNVEVKFNDNHKTFAYSAGASANSSMNNSPTTLSVLNNTNNVVLSEEVGNSNNYNFNQLEIFLVKNNTIQATPAYIVGSNYYKESGNTSSNGNSIYVYGVKDNEVSYDSKKEINEFNSLTYVAKPLGVGFNDLKLGETYELRFNLYEESIFNKVKNLNEGTFFLKDNLLNKVVKVDAATTYSFEANENVNERFAFYWKDVPSTSIVDVVDTPTEISHKTIVYKDNDTNKVKFEGDKEFAKIEVYDASGRLVSSREKVSVDTDYALNLGAKGMYIIKVIYKNQETRVIKFMN